MNEIVAEYNKSLQARCKRSLLNQLVVCSSRWTKGIESLLGLLSKLTPLVLFSSFFEAAVYAKVRTFVNYGDPRSKDATLLGECTTLAWLFGGWYYAMEGWKAALSGASHRWIGKGWVSSFFVAHRRVMCVLKGRSFKIVSYVFWIWILCESFVEWHEAGMTLSFCEL